MRQRLLILALASLAIFGLDARKLSPNAEALLSRQRGQVSTMLKSYTDTAATEVETVKVFINMNDPEAIEDVKRFGGKVFMTFGQTATAEIPVPALRAVSELPTIDYVEMGSPVHLCMDEVREQCMITPVHTNSFGQLPQGYTGADVVVGVIDTGLEYDHIAFRTADGKGTRVKRIWNQNGVGVAPEKFGYGAEYKTEDEIRAARYDNTNEYHGTHTTSIAAGGDRSSKYYGVAPDADIVFVSFGSSTVDIPNAVRYIQDYAESVGKPCVINMSLGSHLGPHNGNSSLDQFFDSESGAGRIFVGSAGNEGEKNLHVGKKFTSDDLQLKTLLAIPSTSSKNTAVDIWGQNGSPITVSVVLTDSRGKIKETYSIKSTDSGNMTRAILDESVSAYVNIVPAGNAEGEAPNVYIEFYISTISDARRLGIIVTGEEGQEVNMWNLAGYDFVNSGLRGWTAGDNTHTVGEIGGTGESVISVGSYNSRFTFPIVSKPDALYTLDGYGPDELPLGEVSFFSSHGPTADGRMKPDVVAPGALVIAGFNKYTADASLLNYMSERVYDADNNDYYYYLNVGTSMSAPVVTGSVALMLQAKPDLTPADIREALAATSTLDDNVGTEPNNSAGYGKLNVHKALVHILARAGIESIGSDPASPDAGKVWMDSGSRQLCVSSKNATEVCVYSVMGSLIGRYKVAPGYDTIDGSTWAPGIYVVKLASSGKAAKVVVN